MISLLVLVSRFPVGSSAKGNERCDKIARAFASGQPLALRQSAIADLPQSILEVDSLLAQGVSDTPKLTEKTTQPRVSASKIAMIESSASSSEGVIDELPREVRVDQLRNLVETLRIADEIASEGYLISSSELADLMDVNASAVTSRGDNWPWRNWIVSRVRREGNQILWQLERVDQVNATEAES
ncbi:MAG: hypothetical protein F6K09_35545 [Merismopedia sp. SIO2A8]|nr:hypothetical protein [Merismopedia sp. SIO2A8]